MLAQLVPRQNLSVEATALGWRITDVSGPAEKVGLERGDLILRINRVPVQSVLAPFLWASLLHGDSPLTLHVRDWRTTREVVVQLTN